VSGDAGMVGRLRAAGCVFAEREADLISTTFPDEREREAAIRRRVAGEPLEYVIGRAAFGEVVLEIGPGCFIPRARAVALVDVADRLMTRPDATALDLGCGVGPIAALLASRHPSWRVLASEVDEQALFWAERNAATFGFSVYAGSWWSGVPDDVRGQLDLVVAHLPYVPTDEVGLLPRDFRDHEARLGVDGGSDGLDPLRAVSGDASAWLTPDGALLTQVSHAQRPTAALVAARAGLVTETIDAAGAPDDAERDTVVLALRPWAGGPR
jgi:release factor glutamine methyltransferase